MWLSVISSDIWELLWHWTFPWEWYLPFARDFCPLSFSFSVPLYQHTSSLTVQLPEHKAVCPTSLDQAATFPLAGEHWALGDAEVAAVFSPAFLQRWGCSPKAYLKKAAASCARCSHNIQAISTFASLFIWVWKHNEISSFLSVLNTFQHRSLGKVCTSGN